MNNQASNRRTLPPGIEDIVFGIMWIKIGRLRMLANTKSISHKVQVQFWGEQTPIILDTEADPPAGGVHLQQYEISCPVVYFESYLLDMKHNLKIMVENLGYVHLDITHYLNTKIEITSKSIIDHFKGFFEIVGKNNKKVGSLEIQMHSNFNPQIALREKEKEDQIEQEIQRCPVEVEKLNNSPCACGGTCPRCIGKKNALDILAIQKPQLLKQFYEQSKQRQNKLSSKKQLSDERIPNSLNLKQNKEQFNPDKYAEPEPKLQTPKQPQNFPSFEKILTYSNLKLDKELQKKQNYEITEQLPRQIQQVKSQKKQKSTQKIRQEQKIFPVSHHKIQQKQVSKQKQNLYLDFYGQNKIPSEIQKNLLRSEDDQISKVSQVPDLDKSESLIEQKEILSRVVNLDREMQKQKQSPKKNNREVQSKVQVQRMPIQNMNRINELLSIPITNKVSRTSMILELLIEIQTQSVQLNTSRGDKFIIAHHPYGQKQRIKLGPQFGSKITIMCHISEHQILMMRKNPFILQFWSSLTSKFQGIVKLNLKKIYEGFLLEGRLNETAIKTNLMPTIVSKGLTNILDIKDTQVGTCNLLACIGTSSQLEKYINSDQNSITAQKMVPFKPISIPENNQAQHPEIKQQGKTKIQYFSQLLDFIDVNNQKIFQNLISFSKNDTIINKDFIKFLDQIQYKGRNIFNLIAQKQILNTNEISFGFKDYKQIKDSLLIQFKKSAKTISKHNKLKSILNNLKERSTFGLIKKIELEKILNQQIPKGLTSVFIGYFPEHAKVDSIIESLGNANCGYDIGNELPIWKNSHFQDKIGQLFIQNCLRNGISAAEAIIRIFNNKSEIPITQFQEFMLKDLKWKSSKWYILNFIETVNDFFEQQSIEGVVKLASLFNWINIKIKSQKLKPEKEQSEQNEKNESNEEIENSEDQQMKRLIKPKREQPSLPQIVVNNSKQEDKKQQEQKQDPKRQQQESPSKPLIDEPQPQIVEHPLKHTFSITPLQLIVDTPYSGECQLTYTFPFEQDSIKSKKTTLFKDKHKYKLTCCGIHKFIIHEHMKNYLNESFLKFQVSINGKIQLEGNLHSDELIMPDNSNELKIVPLFDENINKISAKLKLSIEYECKESKHQQIGKETIYDVFLPKNGYLNFALETQIDQTRLRQQINLKEEFYLVMVADIFGETNKLLAYYPPVSSKLYSDFNYPLKIYGSIKLGLNNVILDHFRQKSCNVKLNIVYYSKEKGNYERKQQNYANFKIPLLAIIKQEGIEGDYALKNRLGMFVSVCQAKFKYQKEPKHFIESLEEQHKNPEMRRESYWLILNFLEIINFEQQTISSIKLQYLHKSKRHSTQKIYLHDDTYANLKNQSILLHMSEQQFISTKILPISIITNSNKYAIDLNLKHVARNLSKQKCMAASHYFIVVDQHSKPKRIRLGTKIYGMRGHIGLANFVDSFYHNLPIDVFEEMDIPHELNNHAKMLDVLRSKLKMSERTFEQAVKQLIPNKRKDKIPQEFLTSQIHYQLDLTPILSQSQSQIDLLCSELPTQIMRQDLMKHIQQNDIRLTNLRQQFLERYSFRQLDKSHIDKNIDFLGLSEQIDLITFVRKIKIISQYQQQLDETISLKQLKFTFLKGFNFHYLYNGIKPNPVVKIPALGIETTLQERDSQPIFDETFRETLSNQNLHEIRRIKLEVYHVTQNQEQEELLIGQGWLSIADSLAALKQKRSTNCKIYKVVIDSLMSSKMKASVDVKVEILTANAGNTSPKRFPKKQNALSQLDEESQNDMQIQDMMKDINKGVKNKLNLFESSDQEY